MHLHRRERTIAAILRDAGYATAHYGKWHLARGKHGHAPWRFGFEHSNGSYLAASALLRDFTGWVRVGRASQQQPFFAYPRRIDVHRSEEDVYDDEDSADDSEIDEPAEY